MGSDRAFIIQTDAGFSAVRRDAVMRIYVEGPLGDTTYQISAQTIDGGGFALEGGFTSQQDAEDRAQELLDEF